MKRLQTLRTTRARWAILVVALIGVFGAWAVFGSSLTSSDGRGAPQRESELCTILAQIPPPDGAVYERTGVIDLLGIFQVQDVYDKPPSHPNLIPHYDAVLRAQGWSFLGTQTSDEGGRELTSWRKGPYQFTLVYPVDSMNLDYPFEVIFESR